MTDAIKIARCARCASTFVRIRFPVCDGCIDDEEADYKNISDVLAENSNQNVEIVAGLAGVSVACVLRMLDRGLIANDQVSDEIRCGRCGKPAISSAKKLCQQCLVKLDQIFCSEISEAKRVREINDSDATVHDTINLKRQNILNPKKR